MKTNYRKIWENIFGEIPKDKDGRSFEIHHKDGNRNNNSKDNLMCISIKEHYDIHYQQGDFGACVLIAKRMDMPSDYLSKIQIGVKRPGIGGVKKGTVPWNKGKNGYTLSITEDGKNSKIRYMKMRSIIKDEDAEKIRADLKNNTPIKDDSIGKKMRNGKVMTYERAFCIHYSKKYNVTPQYIYRIIKGKSKIV
jgi:hypothetical protein